MSTDTDSTRRGRPRSAESERAILQAALDLLAEGQGAAMISVSAIARRAGAGKDTIYRRWPSKEDLLLDALTSQLGELEVGPDATLREVMIVILAEMISRFQKERDRRILQSLRAGEDFPKLRRRYREVVVNRRHEVVSRYVEAAIAAGEIRDDPAVRECAEMPFHHVLMAALDDRPVQGDPTEAAARLVDAILDGIRRTP